MRTGPRRAGGRGPRPPPTRARTGPARSFPRRRADDPRPVASYAILGVTVVVSLVAFQPGGGDLLTALWLDKQGLAAGEGGRLVTPVLVPGSPVHPLFNMYFLYPVG